MSSPQLTNPGICSRSGSDAPVALVSMPWGSILKPPLGVALLKSCLRTAGFRADVHFLNMNFAQQIGLERYELLAERGHLHGEWLFAQVLFGNQGLRQGKSTWEEVKNDPRALELGRALRTGGNDIGQFVRELMETSIPEFIDDAIARVPWWQYRLVGFSTTFAQSLSSLLLAKRIRERWPQTKIIFGGACVESDMGLEFLRAFPWIDFVADGEAETSLPALVASLVSGSEEQIPGIARRRGPVVVPAHGRRSPVDLERCPVPDYSDYLRQLESRGWRKKELRLYFESSRGCWWGEKHHCSFCGLNGQAIAFRHKSAGRVLDEILELAREYRCLRFAATDNVLPLGYVSRLLPELSKLDLDLDLFYEAKGNLNRDQLRALASAGVRTLQPGIESFNSRLLEEMDKGITPLGNVQLLKWCWEYEIDPIYNLLFDLPGESPSDYAHIPDWFALLGHLRPPASIHPISFHRFSPYHDGPRQYGLELVPDRMYEQIFPRERVDIERIAYYFERARKAPGEDPVPGHIAAMLSAWERWKQGWRRTFCYYEKGPGYIDIYDNRVLPDRPGCRLIQLDERVSALYLWCDQGRSLESIHSAMKEKFMGLGQGEVDAWLRELVARGLLLREGNRYLALAVRMRNRQRTASVAMAARMAEALRRAAPAPVKAVSIYAHDFQPQSLGQKGTIWR